MVKTTVMLDDEIYKRLIDESIRKYGSTKKLSFLINEKLRENRRVAVPGATARMTVRLGRKLTEKELEKEIGKAWSETTKWSA